MTRKKSDHGCLVCGTRPIVNYGLCRKHRIQDIKRMIKHIEKGKELIAGSLSEQNKEKWNQMTSQAKKLAVFKAWEYGWLYWEIKGSKNRVINAITKNFNKFEP